MTTTDPGYRIATIAEVWPEHAGHTVRYSEHGRTDYNVTAVYIDASDPSGDTWVASAEYDSAPIDGDLTETEYWCRTCGTALISYWDAP